VYERRDFDEAVHLLADGVIPTDLLISKIVPLSRVQGAFEELEQGSALKILVDVGAVE